MKTLWCTVFNIGLFCCMCCIIFKNWTKLGPLFQVAKLSVYNLSNKQVFYTGMVRVVFSPQTPWESIKSVYWVFVNPSVLNELDHQSSVLSCVLDVSPMSLLTTEKATWFVWSIIYCLSAQRLRWAFLAVLHFPRQASLFWLVSRSQPTKTSCRKLQGWFQPHWALHGAWQVNKPY